MDTLTPGEIASHTASLGPDRQFHPKFFPGSRKETKPAKAGNTTNNHGQPSPVDGFYFDKSGN
jgi:hypothetical protein